MQSVRMHLDGNGVVWAMAKCRVRGEVHEYLVSEVLAGAKCKICRHPMHHAHGGHHHAPNPVAVSGTLAEGTVEMIETVDGERMRFTASPDDHQALGALRTTLANVRT